MGQEYQQDRKQIVDESRDVSQDVGDLGSHSVVVALMNRSIERRRDSRVLRPQSRRGELPVNTATSRCYHPTVPLSVLVGSSLTMLCSSSRRVAASLFGLVVGSLCASIPWLTVQITPDHQNLTSPRLLEIHLACQDINMSAQSRATCSPPRRCASARTKARQGK